MPNEESSNVVVCVSGITRRSDQSCRLQVTHTYFNTVHVPCIFRCCLLQLTNPQTVSSQQARVYSWPDQHNSNTNKRTVHAVCTSGQTSITATPTNALYMPCLLLLRPAQQQHQQTHCTRSHKHTPTAPQMVTPKIFYSVLL